MEYDKNSLTIQASQIIFERTKILTKMVDKIIPSNKAEEKDEIPEDL